MDEKTRVEKIKEGLTIGMVADKLGLQPKESYGTQAISCFKHIDKHPSLVLLPDVNRFECKSCGAKGDVLDLICGYRECDVRDAMDWISPKEEEVKVYIVPDNYLSSRGITDATARKFNITTRGDTVVIPVPGGEKYRRINPERGEAKYSHKLGTAGGIFKTISSASRVILTEGEFDALIVWQNTGYPAWTNTTGAGTDFAKHIADFDTIDKIFVAYDNDDPGTKGAREAAESLGVERCYKITPPFGKDWTEFFLMGGSKENFDELLANAIPYKVTLADLLEEQLREDHFKLTVGIPDIDEAIGGFRSRNTYLLAGLEKSGKSSLLLNFLHHFFENEIKVGYVNTEFPLLEFVNRVVAIDIKKPKNEVEQNPNYAREWTEKYKDHLLYAGIEQPDLIKDKNVLSWKKTTEAMEAMVEKGARVIMVDNLTSYTNQGNSKKQSWEVLSSAISELVNFAKEKNVVVFMVIHQKPSTTELEGSGNIRKIIESGDLEQIWNTSIIHVRRPTLGDVYGGGGALSQISGAMFVWRPFQKFGNAAYSTMTKIILESFRHSAGGGEIRVDFDGPTGLFLSEPPF